MAAQLPALDSGSTLWLEQIEKATLNNTTCSVPRKYFDVLFAWGYVEGVDTAAKLTGAGLAQSVSDKEADKQAKKSTKKSRKKKSRKK